MESSFEIFALMVAKMDDGKANVKHVWHGASSREEIVDIIHLM